MKNDDDVKRYFVDRQKRFFNNLYRFAKAANERGSITDEELNTFRSNYNKIVYEDAKKAYLEHRRRQSKNQRKQMESVYEFKRV